MFPTLRRLCAAITVIAICSSFVFAQVSSLSSISGSVADPTGAVVAGAVVTVKNNATNAEFKATTANNGTFSIPALNLGMYTVTVSAPGFKQALVNNVQLESGTPASVRVALEVGDTSESVVVEGGGEVMQTQSATISTTLNVSQIANLPLVSRNAMDFMVLLPGVNTPTTARASSINGLPDHAFNITVDGINSQDNYLKSSDGFFSRITPRLDAIEEMTVSVATPGAESSGQGAVQIRFATRRGTNEFHGSLYEYHRNSALNANYWFNNRDQDPIHKDTRLTCGTPQQAYEKGKCKAPRDQLILNQYGFRFGGPIRIPKLFNGRDKAFFFTNYEEYRLPTQISRQRTILTPSAQQGLFRYNVTSGGQTQVREVNLLQLASRSNHTATADPTIAKLLTDINDSTKNTGGIVALTDPNLQRFTFINKSSDVRYYTTIRFDFNLSEKHQLESSYYYEKHQREKDILNSNDPAFPGFPNFGSQLSHRFSESLALRSTLSSSMVNEARFGFNGGTVLFTPNVTASQFVGPFGSQGGFHLDLNTAVGISNVTRSTGTSRRNTPLWQINDTLNWTRGAHTYSFGGAFTNINLWLYSKTVVPEIDFGVNAVDPAISMFVTANFPGAANSDLNRAANLYSVLTGRVISISANAQLDEKTGQYVYLGDRVQRGRQREWGFFAQDAWRTRPNLTLTYGLRWELQMPFTPLNDSYTTTSLADIFGVSGLGNLFKPGTQTGRVTEFVQYKKGDRAYNVDYKNFAPTFGFAWTPNVNSGWLKNIVGEGKTVLRGGYSIAYTRPSLDEFSDEFGANPGSFITASRSINLGNLVGGNLGSLPLLMRETNRLGPPAFADKPVYPLTGVITNSANIFDPNLKVPYVQSWTFGIQREITKNMAFEVRYVGNRSLRGWTEYDLNEVNIVENGFLNEFKLAQANLQANIAANRGAHFRYAGPNTGTSPLPTMLAYFSGATAAQANDQTRYASTLFANTTFINLLALNNPAPTTFATTMYNDAGRRTNALNAGLPRNLFLVNPDLQGGSSFTGNGGYTRYDALQFELRRRLANGLQVQGNYVFAKSFSSSRVSLRAPRVNALGGTLEHAVKANWVYELPMGRGKALFGGAGAFTERLVGGWEFHGTARVQSGQVINFGNVNLVGMTNRDLQNAFKLRFDDANRIIFALPQDIIDNTIKAFSVSATSATGYGSLGAPTGRYIAPANSRTCIQVVSGDCGFQNVYVTGPMFTRVDMSAVKKTRITERVNFELRAEILNTFNNANIFANTNITNFTNPLFGQATSAYRDTSNTQDPGGRLVQLVARINF